MSPAPAVVVRGLAVRLGRDRVLHGLDLAIRPGELMVLLGPSGCGKSTLLQAIAGLVDTEAGSVRIGDRDVSFDDPKDRGIGMVFQSYALYPTMTVERNLSFGLRAMGTPRAEVARRVQRVAQWLELGELLHRKPAQLSGGQRQRVAIGRALVRDARVFLFDEPLSNLDARLRTELRREIKQLHRDLGVTMLYVTHDQVEAMTLATRLAVMRDGRILQVGTPAEVYARPVDMFVGGFLGSPGMNFIEGRLGDVGAEGSTFVAGRLSLRVPREASAAMPPAGPVVLGIRPEHITLHRDRSALAEPHGDLADVVLVEPLGAQALAWLQHDGVRLAALTAASDEPTPGERLHLRIDMRGACLFDPVTQRRL